MHQLFYPCLAILRSLLVRSTCIKNTKKSGSQRWSWRFCSGLFVFFTVAPFVWLIDVASMQSVRLMAWAWVEKVKLFLWFNSAPVLPWVFVALYRVTVSARSPPLPRHGAECPMISTLSSLWCSSNRHPAGTGPVLAMFLITINIVIT